NGVDLSRAGHVRDDFRGQGPRNYRRSDQRITEDVCDGLTEHPMVDASDLEVQVKDGEVTLTGTVPDRRSKRLARDIADSVAGVRDVHNEVTIRR
ncbi:MAG TPA: BON domain-containing protein, partial [Gemmatimonadales bacterium]|nr:BON domain-containing protein [Gemmatimonadales bacterium]